MTGRVWPQLLERRLDSQVDGAELELTTLPTGSQEAGRGGCNTADGLGAGDIPWWLSAHQLNRAGRVRETHCPDENTEAQDHRVWVGVWPSADPAPFPLLAAWTQVALLWCRRTGTCPTNLSAASIL